MDKITMKLIKFGAMEKYKYVYQEHTFRKISVDRSIA
jgi:hypothetical protein